VKDLGDTPLTAAPAITHLGVYQGIDRLAQT